jgi:hypothetical protein
MLAILLATTLLTACGSGNAEQAHAAKAKLDQELTHARTDLGIPDRLLGPVTSQEQKVASGEGGVFYNYDDAAKNYNLLYTQLTGIEQTAKQTLQQQAQVDMQAFATILNERRGEGFIEIDAYQSRYDDATQAFAQAQTAADFAHVDDIATAQTQALQAMWPAYQKLQELQSVIKALSAAGASTQLAQQLYDQDLQIFRDAASADRYDALTSVIDAQIVQVQANQATALPYLTKSQLDLFQASTQLLKQYYDGFKSDSVLLRQYQEGNTPGPDTFLNQYDADKAQFAQASQTSDYTKLAATLTTQRGALSSPLIRAKAIYDYTQLVTLTNSIKGRTMVNEQPDTRYQSGVAFKLAYEYLGEDGVLDNDIGIGPASIPESQTDAQGHNRNPGPGRYAKTDAGYEEADFRITSVATNLRAMLDNYDPATDEVNAMDASVRINPVHEQAHKADLQLMQYYGVTSGKVIIVSLREQVARFYQGGNLQAYTYVTTGDPAVPSVPGFWTAINRHSPADPNTCSGHPSSCPRDASGNPLPFDSSQFGDLFTSPEPPGSPGYYNPTPIHWDIAYHDFGFWLHDAYWRHQFGPETDLPHYDPNAFSGGSHGCVNIPLSTTYGVNMEWVFNWTPLGTPIIIY